MDRYWGCGVEEGNDLRCVTEGVAVTWLVGRARWPLECDGANELAERDQA